MKFQTIKDIDVKGKKVLLRADLNVPKHNNQVTDTTRIDRLKPTIDYLVAHGAKVLILSHFGRPDGAQNPQMSLAFLTPVLEKSWGVSVRFSQDCIGPEAEKIAQSIKPGEVVLMENVRFHKGEEANENDFTNKLASLGEIFVNDAFSAAHRAHASTEGLAHHMPAVAGLLMAEELDALRAALVTPEKPVFAVVGGSKISTKLDVLQNMIEKVDYLALGGGMANTFLYAKGYDIGQSLCEKDMVNAAKDIMLKAEKIGCEIILPKDVIVVTELKENAPYKTVAVSEIPADGKAIDVGPQSIAYITEKVKASKTVVWNGPMGVFEIKPFDAGTNAVAKIVAEQTRKGACKSIAGGGDTVSALENAKSASDFTYISTAGGAFLEWLEGKELPGVKALTK